MNLLDSKGVVKKYDTPQKILQEFYEFRLPFYKERKEKLLKKAHRNLEMAENKVKFIKDVQSGKINLCLDKEKLCAKLEEREFKKFDEAYDYLLLMPIVILTASMLQGLEAECLCQQDIITKLSNTTEKHLWMEDLDAFEKQLDANELSELDRTTLYTDLQSLIGTKWITDGVIERIFTIFSQTTFKNDKIQFLMPQMTMDEIKSSILLDCSFVFIPLRSAQNDDDMVYFSLLVWYTGKKGKNFSHYDILGINNEVAESVAKSIIAEANVRDAIVSRRPDKYNCGVYVLAITEVICEWFINNEARAHKYNKCVKKRLKDFGEVEDIRKKYWKMIEQHEAEKLSLKDFQAFDKMMNDAINNPTEDVGHVNDVPINKGAGTNVAAQDVVNKGATTDALSKDLQSLEPREWLTDGAIDRMFKIFVRNLGNEDDILLIRQCESVMLRDKDTVNRHAFLDYKLVFIPLNNKQMDVYGSDGGGYFSLLVLDNTKAKKGLHVFRHYDTSAPANKKVAKDIATMINGVIPCISKKVKRVTVAQQQDSYNCGVYVLAITEAIYKWYNEKSDVMDVMDAMDVMEMMDWANIDAMRTKYKKMIKDHGCQD